MLVTVDWVPLTDPFTLKHLDFVAAVFPGHNVGILLFQSRHDNRLELFHETISPFPKRARVVGADIGNRINRELRAGADVHRIDDETERWDEAARENCRFSSQQMAKERGWEKPHSGRNRPSIWESDQGMEVVSKRNDESVSQVNTDPFLYEVDIVAVLIETWDRMVSKRGNCASGGKQKTYELQVE